jgi:tetratricopeptide (TPR) repeat protein
MVTADSKAKFLNDAERYLLQGKIQLAIGEYQKIIQSDPNDVLILNTIGDLYLRLGEMPEANQCFSQVAETYVRNNFLLKAIAVYKKILSADPHSLEINMTIASLYAKQGLNIEARNQYIRIAALFEQAGDTKALQGIFEKVVELDPANVGIQRKLAELYLAEGATDKGHSHLIGAARAQAKAGDPAGAMVSFERALQLNQLDVEALKGFLECCLSARNVKPALEQLKKALEMTPDNLDLREMLGRAHLADDDPEAAANAFQSVVSMDESRYESFFSVAQAFVQSGDYERAASCLDPIIAILITRRETNRAASCYEQILGRSPHHIPALTRLASLYSAAADQIRYLEVLDKIAGHYISRGNNEEALEYLEKILQSDPESEKHQKLHRKIFEEAYPDTPYVAPVILPEARVAVPSVAAPKGPSASGQENPADIVEADLLMNYGMREKALNILQNLEARDPYDKKVRTRLLSLFKEEGKYTEAAEQSLLLAALYRKSNDEESAHKYLNEANQLDPEMAANEQDLEGFARKSGILMDSDRGRADAAGGLRTGSEVDLSGDLLEIFFPGDRENGGTEDAEPLAMAESIPEVFPQSVQSQAPAQSMQEKLQEVDFYIRLGFHSEALSKLNEIAKMDPDNPELPARYKKLEAMDQPASQQPTGFAMHEDSSASESAAAPHTGEMEVLHDKDIDAALNQLLVEHDFSGGEADSSVDLGLSSDQSSSAATDILKAPERPFSPASSSADAPKPNGSINEMFADLIEEVSSLPNQEITEEAFEDHFSLGTAYREMDLIEEAIKEFQSAMKAIASVKDSQKVIQCCGMLSTCFIKKGMPRSAVRWCQTGLSVPGISSHEAMALRYDMGVAYSMDGNPRQALQCFDQIFSSDPGYRDVAQRIDEIKGGFDRHAP